MKLAKMQDEKNLVPYNQAAPNVQMMPQEQGMGQQFMDMAKQKAMSSVLDKGVEAAIGSGAGSAGMAGMATAMPYVGMGLMGAKLLGLFNQGGLIGPLSPQYNAEGTPTKEEMEYEYTRNLGKLGNNKAFSDMMSFEDFLKMNYPQLYKDTGGKVKPDYLDLDGDGNKKEPMKQAAKSKGPLYNSKGTKKKKEANTGLTIVLLGPLADKEKVM